MRYKEVFAWIAVLAIAAPEARGNSIYVPGDQPTIQAGINSTSPGDTVVLSDGVYTGAGNYNIDFAGNVPFPVENPLTYPRFLPNSCKHAIFMTSVV